ncbi:hypothetical protein [Hyphomonas johnsonii]|nr:hypothetical protein [Hyphomonas johnsonii]
MVQPGLSVDQMRIVRFLRDPATFGGRRPAYFNTAVSHLFVDGPHLYVLHKPVRCDGYSCQTPEERWHWCEAQCMRAVPRTGRGPARPLPIVRRANRFFLGGPGSIQDWVLKISCASVAVDSGLITLNQAA